MANKINKKQALDLAKENNIKVKTFSNDGESGYLVGSLKVLYAGYGNNFNIEGDDAVQSLGVVLARAINKQI